jgi:hypothetical protein
LNQKDINHLNRSITSNKTEAEIKNLPTKNSLGPGGFTAKIYQTFKEEQIPILLKLFHGIFKEGTLILISQYYIRSKTQQRCNKKKRTVSQYL